ncbi:MAG: murein biosynthesis integral membrane protein MurJ [Verrucomicrobia bacterium]|nr:murein biosynthesis integral membrane protein MurJ [Verrucomicrobiota bacterium]
MALDALPAKTEKPSGRPALLIGIGILLSRVVGLVRDRALSHYLGTSDAADAFRAALRIPNFLQNLFGEGVLSASFIPVYARLLGAKNEKEADEVASIIGSLLAALTASLVLLGILSAPFLIEAIAPGFVGAKRELTITLVQIMFPGVGALVLSAWCLGILNSHGRFFLSYTAPVVWNVIIIATLLIFRGVPSLSELAVCVAWGSVAGSVGQLLVQLPTVLRVTGRLRISFNLRSIQVRQVFTTFGPVFVSRGVVQLSAYIDSLLASLLPSGSVTLLMNGQTIALLPVSLFGMSISAAELPAMSRAIGSDEQKFRTALATRLTIAMQRMAFFVIPASAGFFGLGDTIGAFIYQSGLFTHRDSLYLWALLAGSGIGLLASTFGRLCSSTFYALRDTRTPLKFAVVRVILTTLLGYLFAFPLPRLLHVDPKLGLAGLTVSAGIAGWIEFLLLRWTLRKRVDPFSLSPGLAIRLWGAALLSVAIVFPLKSWFSGHPLIAGMVLLPLYGALYIGGTLLLRVPEAWAAVERAMRVLRRR